MKTRRAEAERPSTLSFRRDELAPYQYWATFHRQLPLLPEKSLQLALLKDAILTFQEKLFAGDTKSKILVRETEEWIWSSDSDGFFSFENVCEALNISASFLRRHLLLWKNHAIARRLASAKAGKPWRRIDNSRTRGRGNLIRAKTILRKPHCKKVERRHSDVANPGFGQ